MAKQINHPHPDQLQAFFDQALDQESACSLQEHLELCLDCREELARLENLTARLESLPEFALERDFSLAVLSQLKENQMLSRRITWTLVLEALAAGAVIGALIPVIRVASWLPGLVSIRQELLAAVNIFLTQLASSWIVWWAQLQLNLKTALIPLLSQTNFPAALPSPWILILAAVSMGVLINYLLLRLTPLNNHQQQI
jgi:anti-sigma factor RsiW